MKPGNSSSAVTIFRILAGIFSIGCFIVLWSYATNGTPLGKLLPGPTVVLGKFVASFTTKIGKYTILGHAMWSLSRVMIAYTAAAVIGIGLGLAMGWYRVAEAIFRPFYEMIRPIPPIAWIPIAIIWFGLGESAKYFLIFLSAFASITLNSFDGARSVDRELVGAAKMLGANDRQLFTSIVLPASTPYIFAGLQVALSTSWATVLAAEMVRSSEGVGWVIVSGMEMNNTTQILVGIIAIGLIGFMLATAMREVEAKLLAWNRQGT
jgi:NitT/TauT family transport system permease protein/sulfonate transport system permease protein